MNLVHETPIQIDIFTFVITKIQLYLAIPGKPRSPVGPGRPAADASPISPLRPGRPSSPRGPFKPGVPGRPSGPRGPASPSRPAQ